MEKTGELVYVRLGQPALTALRLLKNEGRFFFWSGDSMPATVIGNLRRTIHRICEKAKVAGHPHRFRDTFAVRLLENGAALDQVSILLGHTSVKTTEKYYAPWCDHVRSYSMRPCPCSILCRHKPRPRHGYSG